jgi:site-specific DNA-methyltransferase (adenine-specific)
MTWNIINGDNREVLKQFPDNHFDAIVTDPPYGIDFLGKDWDADTGSIETYRECFRVLKPGGHILAFSAARTYHHLAISIERAGFEIRDQIMWIYSSGFPKSQDVGRSIDRAAGKKDPNYGSKKTAKQGNEVVGLFSSGARCNKCNRTFNADIIKECKEEPCGMRYEHQTDAAKQWSGWGTQLKPAHEPICMARKPMKDSVAKNVQQWGTGALNIDVTRVPYESELSKPSSNYVGNGSKSFSNFNPEKTDKDYDNNGEGWDPNDSGRFPSNVIGEIAEPNQKYFYCPKVSRAERHIGHEMPEPLFGDVKGCYDENGQRFAVGLDHRKGNVGNNHPTVKPVELMKYLIKMVTAPGGKVLDPFNGSGSTGMAAVELGFDYTGIELDPAYVDIANKRIEAWDKKHNLPGHLFK